MMLEHLQRYTDRIEAKRDVLLPDVRWDGRREKTRFLDTLVRRRRQRRRGSSASTADEVDPEEAALT